MERQTVQTIGITIVSKRSSMKRMQLHKAKKRSWKSDNAKWRKLPPTVNQAAVLARHGITAPTRGEASKEIAGLSGPKRRVFPDVRRLGSFAK